MIRLALIVIQNTLNRYFNSLLVSAFAKTHSFIYQGLNYIIDIRADVHKLLPNGDVSALNLDSRAIHRIKSSKNIFRMRNGLLNKYTTTGVYKDNLFICSIAYYGREVCFHSKIKVGARIFRARGYFFY